MSDYTFYPVASEDDGYSFSGGFNNNYSYSGIGKESGVGYYLFVRFVNVTIPQGATITECYVKFGTKYNFDSGNAHVNCQFNDVDNATAPTTSSQVITMSVGDSVNWDIVGAWTVDSTHDTPSLNNILEAIVGRVGWVSGNAIVLRIVDNGSDNPAYRSPKTFDNGAGYPELHVTYSETITGDIDLTFPALILTANTINVGTSDITFPSFVILSYIGAVSSIEIPVLSLDCTATNAVNTTEINFPSLEIESYTGVIGTITFPSLICTATTTYGVVELTFPSLIISSYTGAGSQLNLPVPTLVATVSNIAHGAISLPHLIGTSAAYHINLLEAMVLPKLTLVAQTGENAILQSSIPKLVLTAGTGAQGNIVLSNKFACVATGLSGTLATFSGKISKLNLSATCGSSSSLVLGDIEVIAHGTTGLVGKGVIRIPSLLFVGEGMQGNLCSCLITFPSLRFAAIGLREIIGVSSIITKSLVIYAHGFSGNVGTLIYELPLIELTSTVYRNSIGNSNIILTSIGLESIAETDGKYDSFILKYTR